MSYADWRARFLEAVDESLYPAPFLDWLLDSGQARFWECDTAAIVAEIRQFPSGVLEVHGTVAAGELDGIKALIPLAEIWGKSFGATRASIASHPAWARLLRDEGYEMSQVTIVKVL